MKKYALLLVAACLLIAADDAKDAAVKKDREKFTGTWVAQSMVRDGEKGDEDQVKNLSVSYDGDGKWSLKFAGSEVMIGTSVIDPSKKPKEVEYTYDDNGDKKFLKGIYELEDNTYKACYAKPGEDKRPTEFESKSGSGHTLTVYKREVKDKDKKDKK